MKQKLSILGVEAIVVILYSIIVFLIPFPKGGVFWLSYIFTLIALFAQLLFLQVAFGTGTSLRSRFYGYPIFRIGMIYLAVQVIASIIFMILAVFVKVPMWIPTICYLIILGLGAIGLIATDNVRDTVVLVEKKHANNTAMIRGLRRQAEVLANQFPELEPVAEALKYADPVSTVGSEGYERQLGDLMQQAAQHPDREQLRDQLLELLNQRNAVCKSSKTR